MNRFTSLNRIAILALVACAALFLFAQPQPPVLSRWSPVSPSVPTIGAVAVPVTDVAPLNIVVNKGLYIDARDRLNDEAHRVYAYVAARFGSELTGPLTVAFIEDAGCALSGIAYTDVRRVQVFTCNAIAPERALAILAHEYVHQLQQDRYGSRHLSADLILSEGMATWGAGVYWLDEHPDFRSYVRAQRANGIAYPLAIHYAERDIVVMNALYYQWASFVEFLIDQYGRERLDALYVAGAGTPGSADYRGVYGKDLATLEQEWIAWLEAAP